MGLRTSSLFVDFDLDLDFDFDPLDFFVLAILFSLHLSFFQSLYQSIPKGMDAYTIFFLLIIVGYLFLYVSGKYYLRDGFQPSESLKKEVKQCQGTIVEFEQPADKPYLNRPINDVDDYEYNVVFQNEGDREVSKATLNKLTAQYPLDWSGLPPSSSRFQEGRKQQVEAYENAPPVSTSNPYKEVDGSNMTPPDTSALEMEERKLLQTYNPKPNDKPTEYDINDAEELIRKIYDKKGLIADVLKKDNNVYEIVGTRRKDEKIIYEGDEPEAPVSNKPNEAAGEDNIIIPQKARDTAAGLDPYYTPGTSTRTGKWDYMRWTPGLERMFAPTQPVQEWY